MFGLDNLIDAIFNSAVEQFSRNERVIKLLKKFNLDPDHPPADFTGVYQYALVEYGVDKPKPVLEIFRHTKIQQLFREALSQNNPAVLLQRGEAFLREHPLGQDIQSNQIDVRREFYEFAAVFIEIAKRTRTPADILTNQKLDSLHRQISSLQERLHRLPTIEGMRTEMARLAAQENPALPGAESFSAEKCRAFALAQQMRGWLETLGYDFESYEIWEEDYFEWIINYRIGRRRYSRALVRGVDGEIGLADVNSLRQSVDVQKADEGWLVTTRRISRAARDEIAKEENEHLGCYTFDEFLDQDADFSGYLTWLEQEIHQRGIDEKYVPLACVKEEVDPATRQRIGVSRYDERDGWIDGYLDVWLDDPAKEHISILGEFGTGKTWFAFHYAWKTLQRYRDAQQRGIDRPRLPLVIPLRDYAKAVSVESLFSEFFFRKHEIPIPGYTAFEQLNRMGKLLLIFDGFDEMAARIDRQQMINNFWELAKVVVPGAKVILTCRTEHFPEAKEGRALLNAELQASTKDLTGETPQFEVLELEKFNDEQIQQVLSYQAQPATVEQVIKNPLLLDLARRPVLTELILEALPDIEAGKPVDMSRVYLYAVRQKMERDIKAERTFTSMADKIYFLCELSWEMLSTDRMSINYREFPDRLRQIFGAKVQEERDLDHWHYDMMGQTILIRNEAGDYSPAHRSFLEFFVGYKLAAELDILATDFAENGSLAQFQTDIDLVETFGKNILSKAVIDLMLPMISPSTDSKEKLFSIIKSTQGRTKESVNFLGGNAVTLLSKIDPLFLENQKLPNAVLLGADFTNTRLRNLNLKDATILNCNFTQMLGFILAVATSQDGRLIAASDSDGIIHVWDSENVQEVVTLRGHTNRIYSISFAPDNKTLASGSADRTIRIWDLQTGQCNQVLKGHDYIVRSVEFSSDGLTLASGGFDNTLKLWNLDQGECKTIFNGHTDNVWSISSCSEKGLLASASSDQTVKIWNMRTGECLQTIKDHQNSVRSVTFTKCGELLASSSTDNTVRIYDTSTWQCKLTISTEVVWTGSISLSTLSNRLAVGDNNGVISIYNLLTGSLESRLRGHTGEVNSLAFDPSGTKIVSGSSDQSVKIWNLKLAQCEKTVSGLSDWVRVLEFNHSGTQLFSGRDDGTISIWDIQNSDRIKLLKYHRKGVDSIAFSPDQAIFAVAGGDRKISLWNSQNFELIRDLLDHPAWVTSVDFSSSTNILASGDDSGTVKLWNIDSGTCLQAWQAQDERVMSLQFHPTGHLLATAGGDSNICNINLWDIKADGSVTLEATLSAPLYPFLLFRKAASTIGLSEPTCCKWKS